MMTSRSLIVIALRSLKNHAFRSFLASLGVVLGVGAVVSMMSISQGAKKQALEQIKSRGINNIIINSSELSDKQKEKSNSYLDIQDYGITEVNLKHISAFDNISQILALRKVQVPHYINEKQSTIGTWAFKGDFLSTTNTDLSDTRSRDFLEHEHKNLCQVCLLGSEAARSIFKFKDPIGQYVKVGKNSFKIIGIVHNKNDSGINKSTPINNQIYIPFYTAKAIFSDYTRVANTLSKVEIQKLYIQVKEIEQLKNTAGRVRSYLKQSHEKDDYQIQIPFELLNQQKATQRIFSIVMGSIAAISLLIGGIGIMNIMLANIYERTREIGTRRALGARKKDIIIQFLAESVIMTILGGLVGIAIGYLISFAVKKYAGMETIITPSSVILSFSVSVGTGIIFGTYPAVKAAALDPIVALRRE